MVIKRWLQAAYIRDRKWVRPYIWFRSISVLVLWFEYKGIARGSTNLCTVVCFHFIRMKKIIVVSAKVSKKNVSWRITAVDGLLVAGIDKCSFRKASVPFRLRTVSEIYNVLTFCHELLWLSLFITVSLCAMQNESIHVLCQHTCHKWRIFLKASYYCLPILNY